MILGALACEAFQPWRAKLAAVADAPIVITGHAYGRRATLAIAGDTLMWRAQRGARRIAENIATTIHDVRGARWLDFAWSRGGAALIALGAMWAVSENLPWGIATGAAGLALVVWRRLRPRHFLVLDIGDRRLILRVTGGSAPSARALAGRIQRALSDGEPPRATPTLP
jgi:predicted dienelactone hydrolase